MIVRASALLGMLLALAGCADRDGPSGVGGTSSSLRRYVFADPATDCQARRSRDAPPVDGVRWSGGCADGFASGEGAMSWYRGGGEIETDQGAFRNGWLEGEATRLLADGSRYSGQWRAGRRYGQGAQLWPDGSVYDGQWRDDRIDGQGSMRSASGQFYQGHWREGKRDGQGVMTWPSGNRYEGGWHADERDGGGKFSWPDGSYFEGLWDGGKPRSKGSLFVDSDGARYLNWEYHE